MADEIESDKAIELPSGGSFDELTTNKHARRRYMPDVSELSDQGLATWRDGDKSQRHYRRWSVDLQANIQPVVWIENEPYDCSVFDLSPTGAGIEVAGTEDIPVCSQVLLFMDGFGSTRAEVRHREGHTLGLLFIHGDIERDEMAQHLLSVPPARRLRRRKVRVTASLAKRTKRSACIIENISAMGAGLLLEDTRHLVQDDRVVLRIPKQPKLTATVRHVSEHRVGLLFDRAFEDVLPAPDNEDIENLSGGAKIHH